MINWKTTYLRGGTRSRKLFARSPKETDLEEVTSGNCVHYLMEFVRLEGNGPTLSKTSCSRPRQAITRISGVSQLYVKQSENVLKLVIA